jgi:hypothetical protein
MVGVVHIVVSPDAEPYPSPRRKGLTEAEILILGEAVEDALARLRISHEGVCLRRGVIDEEVTKEVQGVEHSPRTGVVDFKMKVWRHAMTRIAANGNELSTLYGIVGGTQSDVEFVAGVMRTV